MRRGFTLMELLTIVAVAPFVMLAVSALFATFVRDIPQATRLVQQNTTVLHLLDQLRRDVSEAVAVLEPADGEDANETTLLIGQPQAVVRYRFEDGRTVRILLSRQETSLPAEERIWAAPDAVIEWRPWVQEGRTFGVEVHSHIRQRVAGVVLHKLPGSYVFFLGGFGQTGGVR